MLHTYYKRNWISEKLHDRQEVRVISIAAFVESVHVTKFFSRCEFFRFRTVFHKMNLCIQWESNYSKNFKFCDG